MAITQVEINGISTKAYAKAMLDEYIESGYDAVVVDAADGATVQATATQLKNCIKERELEDQIVCRVIDKKAHLIKATLV